MSRKVDQNFARQLVEVIYAEGVGLTKGEKRLIHGYLSEPGIELTASQAETLEKLHQRRVLNSGSDDD